MCVCVRVYVYVCVCMCACVCVCVFTSPTYDPQVDHTDAPSVAGAAAATVSKVCVCVYVCAHVCVCMCVCAGTRTSLGLLACARASLYSTRHYYFIRASTVQK